jgi:hypothetical protein
VKAKEQFWGRFIKWAFAVLWSPIKTFDEIVKNPSVKGPLLIFLVTIPMTMGVQYLNGSRLFLEQPVPGYDLWTEDFLNGYQMGLWASMIATRHRVIIACIVLGILHSSG